LNKKIYFLEFCYTWAAHVGPVQGKRIQEFLQKYVGREFESPTNIKWNPEQISQSIDQSIDQSIEKKKKTEQRKSIYA